VEGDKRGAEIGTKEDEQGGRPKIVDGRIKTRRRYKNLIRGILGFNGNESQKAGKKQEKMKMCMILIDTVNHSKCKNTRR
jgi:hypothetical protein